MGIHKHHIHESPFILSHGGSHAGIPSATVPHLSLLTRLPYRARVRQNPPSSTARRLEVPVALPTLGLLGKGEESSRTPGGSAGAGPGGGNAEPGSAPGARQATLTGLQLPGCTQAPDSSSGPERLPAGSLRAFRDALRCTWSLFPQQSE